MSLSNVLLFACIFAFACLVALVLTRTVSARIVQSRQDRLKAHLDWVNPTPQSRKRTLARR